MRWPALLAALALLGCDAQKTDAPPAPKSAASAASTAPPSTAPATKGPKAPAALRKAWRESVKYRSSFRALVQNIDGMKADQVKFGRIAKETRMLEAMPVAERPADDAKALQTALDFHTERLGLKDVKVELMTRLPSRPPPTTVLHTDGIHYTPGQLVGKHELTVIFARRADAETWIRALRQLPRMPLITKIATRKGKTIATGEVPYFTALKPTQVTRPRPKVDAIIKHAGGAETSTADKLRHNYAAVDALDAQIEEAFRLEGELKLTTSRFSQFTAHAKALEQMSWLALTGKAPKKPDHHAPKGHKHH